MLSPKPWEMARERDFTMRRQSGWDELEKLLTLAQRRGLQRLDGKSLERLALLYRTVTADLATAQTRGYDPELIAYLNRLTARAHACVYTGSTRNGAHRIARFFLITFPEEVRRSRAMILCASALFIIASVIAYALVLNDAQTMYAFLPAAQVPLVTKSLHDTNFAFDRDMAPEVSALIITNNIQVAALAFAGGMTLGIVTLWALIQNGLMFGGLGALFSLKGYGLDYFATVAPHGVFELTAIQISAGAGLLLAGGIIAPGRLRRIDALKERARRAGVLLVGVAGMLITAGIFEGFVSPQRTSIMFRLSVGALNACALIVYFCYTLPRRFRSRYASSDAEVNREAGTSTTVTP